MRRRKKSTGIRLHPVQTAAQIRSAERDKQAAALRIAGVTMRAISDQLGYGGIPNVVRALDRTIERHRASPEMVERMRDVWLERVERRVLGIEQRLRAVLDDPEMSSKEKFDAETKAADAQAKLGARASKLAGLDAPMKMEHTGRDGGPVQYADVSQLDDAALRDLAASLASGDGRGGGARDPAEDPGVEPASAGERTTH